MEDSNRDYYEGLRAKANQYVTEKKKAERYHRSRRMFVIRPFLGLVLAPMGDSRGHKEWFASMIESESLFITVDEAMEQWARGCLIGMTLYFYRGADFRPLKEDFRDSVITVARQTLVNMDTVVANGVQPGETGEVWEPIRIATLQTLLKAWDVI